MVVNEKMIQTPFLPESTEPPNNTMTDLQNDQQQQQQCIQQQQQHPSFSIHESSVNMSFNRNLAM